MLHVFFDSGFVYTVTRLFAYLVIGDFRGHGTQKPAHTQSPLTGGDKLLLTVSQKGFKCFLPL